MMIFLKLLKLKDIRSQLAGFFIFILLNGCQPVNESETELMAQAKSDPVAAMQLGKRRLAAAEYDTALSWFRQAAFLGDSRGLAHAIQLQQRQQGRLATAQWLQHQLNERAIPASQLSFSQLQQLGLWEKARVKDSGWQHPQACKLIIQPVVSTKAGADSWLSLLSQWRQDPAMSQLPVCFADLLQVPSTELACSEIALQRIECNYWSLRSEVAAADFSQLLVLAGRGSASYNNGILQLPDNAMFALLRHEFMHVLGFIDEYKLPIQTAEHVCQAGKIHPNIVLADDLDRFTTHWSLNRADLKLGLVDTCASLSKKAYRITAAPNLMQYFELELPSLHLHLALKILQQSALLMPVQYYFAFLARQRQDWQQWQVFINGASQWGYADAEKVLQNIDPILAD